MTAIAATTLPRPRRGLHVGLALVALLLLMALLGPWLSPYDPTLVNLDDRLLPASSAHWLGTDHLGRDVFSRLIVGTRLSLGSVVLTLGLVLILGVVIGGIAGVIGGKLDMFLMRLCDMFLTFPTLVLAFFLIAVLGTGLTNVIIAIALSHWAWYARMVRGMVIAQRNRDYVLASRLAGASRLTRLRQHIMPNVVGQLLVLASMDIGHMMLHVSGLSFLGLGVSPPTPEWGVMINDSKEFIWTHPQLLLWPGLMIFLAVMAFNLLGDALRDRLDPGVLAEIKE
ncbi:nickel ABC transporter permease subunit NikC [Pseudomonas lundensis]|uniref:nickel ABC transporter permease subunit NikC n=1 Tax=Pseudomonas TaxID=286 RepID=UPI000642533A|nr:MULTISPECIES: nickel ABC transporter permease subunit NikC [Pseudomonas]MCT8951594.1 nickel ABC transporter permease subunit NikC [Pseudomonas lundensis]NNA17829.1 nickel ABC transporter permease subunit NikC [Pseudomonas lundensis]NNA34878.1 nickel ABC transporter permease subunit NikC [Pseudomonas lundensis]HCS09143.1 nickel ABC transporter permease subunit NikC [Pseudomonas sp.]